MSRVRGLIARSRPIMLQSCLQQPAILEAAKGASRVLSCFPVALEPPFSPVRSPNDLASTTAIATPQAVDMPRPSELLRQQIYISPLQERSWTLMDNFLRELRGVHHRVALEAVGNSRSVGLFLTSHRQDARVVQTAFQATLQHSRLRPMARGPLDLVAPELWLTCRLHDLIAPAAYSKLLTMPEHMGLTPISVVLYALGHLPDRLTGIYQCVFEPVQQRHFWHGNIGQLFDYEYLMRMIPHTPWLSRAALSIPSDDSKLLAEQNVTKADPNRPLFAAALRLGILGKGSDLDPWLRTLDVFSGLMQHGGRSWDRLTQDDYQNGGLCDPDQLLQRLMTFRPGFLVNSLELSSMVHLPLPETLKEYEGNMASLEHLTPKSPMDRGSFIGDCVVAGRNKPICINLLDRPKSTELIGLPGSGKSECLKQLILGDILRGDGVCVMDPHGDLIDDLLDLIPLELVEKVVLLDWSSPSWIPVFNPLAGADPGNRGLLADNLVAGLKGLSEGWGHRAEHILRSVLHGLLHLPRVSLLDVSDAVVKPRGFALQSQILQVVQDPLLRRFWEHDLLTLAAADRNPVLNKLGLLLDIPPVSYTFMQRKSRFSFRKAIEERQIVLIKLSGIGDDSQSTLGSMLLSLLQAEILSRGRLAPQDRHPFQAHIDEAHKFKTNSLESILVQCRKFQVGLSLSHQYLKQFTPGQADALAGTGTAIIFQTNMADASKLCEGLQGKVTVDDIVSLKPFHAIARIGTEIVRIQTRKVADPGHASQRQKIIERCHQLYYQKAEDLLRDINTSQPRTTQPSVAPQSGEQVGPEAKSFEEL